MANPLKFVQEVRAETSKVTWPTRNETLVTTVMVFILVFLASVFFFVADQILNWIVTLLLGLAG
ncbi:MAG: preprotein translocase subunit SecE [Rhizobiales bacterium TMED83]|jgi:preprotein translocase subunit SecE|nr:preprotein translocase subunit SecE [Rhodobiaceae bacterium]RPF95036.1 MAG: preprotein translocase subunit SecE [Rhizobiales bacterium TMED83]HCD16339.1 preprotein translocase subunit SecE [Rhodobiaceae bacterium]|tara:strand:- start:478 stop:669 length:192 start_codon:yes stop_codon:yes gene_type:complete